MHKKILASAFLALAASACAPKAPPASEHSAAPAQNQVAAQQPQMTHEEMMEAWKKSSTPAENHTLLKQYVGSWRTESKFWHAPGQAPEVTKGSAKFSSVLGGRFVEQQYNGKVMGKPFSGKGVLGYDNVQGKFVSNWMDTMGTGLMMSTGTLDQNAKAIKLTGEFFCPVMKQNVATREVMTTVANNRFVFEMYGPGMDGKEMKMLEITYMR